MILIPKGQAFLQTKGLEENMHHVRIFIFAHL